MCSWSRTLLRATTVVAALACAPLLAHADLEVGQPAPDFSLPDQNGTVHHLADYRGKTVVLAFYPKDMTPG